MFPLLCMEFPEFFHIQFFIYRCQRYPIERYQFAPVLKAGCSIIFLRPVTTRRMQFYYRVFSFIDCARRRVNNIIRGLYTTVFRRGNRVAGDQRSACIVSRATFCVLKTLWITGLIQQSEIRSRTDLVYYFCPLISKTNCFANCLHPGKQIDTCTFYYKSCSTAKKYSP